MDRTGFGQYLLNVNWVLGFISFSDRILVGFYTTVNMEILNFREVGAKLFSKHIRGCQIDDKEPQRCHKGVSIFVDLKPS